MIKVRLADFDICIDNKFPYLEKMCEGYIADNRPQFTFSVTDEEIDRENCGGISRRDYLESLAIYRKISELLPYHGAFLMHGAVIDVEGTGVAFLAASGTGKTTHMMNWKDLLGDRMTVVNGDKPLIKLTDGGIFAYGTPWSGKERLNSNIRTPLKKICFIERSCTNECVPVKEDLLKRLLVQTYKPHDTGAFFKTLDMLNVMIETLEFYVIRCNVDASSAQVAYETVIKQ